MVIILDLDKVGAFRAHKLFDILRQPMLAGRSHENQEHEPRGPGGHGTLHFGADHLFGVDAHELGKNIGVRGGSNAGVRKSVSNA